MSLDLQSSLQPYRERIDNELENFFIKLPTLFEFEISSHSEEALNILREFSLRPGKRIRGSLAAQAYDCAAGTSYDKNGLRLGVVLELLQNYLLIIDDVMDRSSERRGRATVHRLYEKQSAKYGGEHESNMMAINIGLIAQHAANLLLGTLDLPAERLTPAYQVLHQHMAATGFGQLDDLYQQQGRLITEADLLRKYALKSSHYTFINPLQLGFVLAGDATTKTMKACIAYGLPAGIAFQLRDDYLGVFGDSSQIGKPNLDDVREGKSTLLVQNALQHATSEDVASLKSIIGKADATEADLRTLQTILIRCGSDAYVTRVAREYAEKAKQALRTSPIGNEQFSGLLSDLIDYSIERER